VSQVALVVDITPDVSLMAKTGQAGHSVADAVAELVDNAIDACIPEQHLTVSVRYSAREGWIEVRDDGTGMSRDELATALVLGYSGKGGSKIGHYGLGMKAACTSLGSRFQITTARESDFYAAMVEYDDAQFVSSGAWELPITRRKKPFERGTVIRINSSRIYSSLDSSLRRNLGSTFKHFIDSGVLTIELNSVEVEPVVPHIIPGSKVDFSGEVQGRFVEGWAALLRVSSQRGWYGFELARNKRVVRRHEKLGFKAHPAVARVVGEIHLDDFETNNLKTDFIRETEQWGALEQFVESEIAGVVSASKDMAKGGTDARFAKLFTLAEHATASHVPARRSIEIAVGQKVVRHQFVEARDGAYASYAIDESDGDSVITVKTNSKFIAGFDADVATAWALRNIAEALVLDSPRDLAYVETVSKLLGYLYKNVELAARIRASFEP
jgi:Histidine kinase-, DNA gyrase B-, and HSP90-like ATPase